MALKKAYDGKFLLLYMLLPMQMEFGSGTGKSKTNLQYNIRKTSTNCVSDDFAYHVQHKNRNYIHGMAFVDFHHRNKKPCVKSMAIRIS